MNRLFIIGRNTKDVDVRFSGSGKDLKTIAHGTIATNEYYEEDATFINFTAFGKTAEFIDKYAYKKGQKLFIFGHLKQNNYTDKDGNKRTSYELIVEAIEPFYMINEEDEEDEEEPQPKKTSSRNNRRK